jgi:hypothetical protein
VGKLAPRIAAALFLLAPVVRAQDLTIVSTVTFGNSVSTATHYLTPEDSRVSAPDTDSIVHFSTGKITMIDRRKQEYWEATAEEMEAYWDRVARDVRGSPLEEMFGLREKPRLEKLPGKRKFAGYDCEHYSLSIGDALEVDFWAAPGLERPARYFDGRKASAAAMGPMGQLFRKMYEELKSVRGLPLSTAIIVRTPVSRTETLDEVTEVKKGPIPASTFDVPAGYRKRKSPFVK